MKPETVFLGEMTSPEVEAFLKVHHTVIVPVGAVEQHGPHVGFTGFKRIVFLNGHYDNTYAIAYACANAADRLPRGVKAFPINYWDGMSAEEAAEYTSLAKGMHAHAAETAAILAINPNLVDMSKANAEFPPFPEFTVNAGPVHTAFFFTSPGPVVLGDQERHVGRRHHGHARDGRALPRSWRQVDPRRAREH